MAEYRWIYGVNPVRELLERRPVQIRAVYVVHGMRGKQIESLEKLCAEKQIPVVTCARDDMEQWVGHQARHQGVAAKTGVFVYADLDDVLDGKSPLPLGEGRGEGLRIPTLILALDSIQDPQNLGSMVRSAHVLGADTVVIPQDRAADITPAVTKASAGAVEHVSIVRVTNLVRALEHMKERGLWIVGATSHENASPPWQLDLKMPLVLVIGSEDKGLRALVEKTCDFRVQIPMAGQLGSLNASVAAGILLYEVLRQRQENKSG